MKVSLSFAVAAALLALPLTSKTASAGVTISDGTFDPGDWVLTQFVSGNGGSVTASQQMSGGNPGDYRLLQDAVASGPSAVAGVNVYTATSFNPAVSGSISSINFSIDFECPGGGGNCFGQGQGFGVIVHQNGNDYIDNFVGITSVSPWTTFSLDGLLASDFGLLSSGSINTGTNPDFSLTGTPIEVGFSNDNSTVTSPFEIDAGYDNFSITINTATVAPEPTAATLFGVGLAALGLFRPRRPR
jgi:hypothetical protein